MTQQKDMHDLTQGSETKHKRDPEDRPVDGDSEHQKREKMHDKTLADSFPTSDPPSSIPDPAEEDSIDGSDKNAA